MSMAPEIPLNEQDKLFYCLECMGPPPIERINFSLEGGSIDIETLRKAYLIELEQYPIFNSVIKDRSIGHKWNLCWVPRKETFEKQAVTAHDLSNLPPEEADKKFRQILFDPFKGYSSFNQAPLKIILCKLPERKYKLMIFFHHASVDLAGVSSFIRDFFETYNRLESNQAIQKNPENIPILASPPILPRSFIKKLYGLLQALAVLVKLIIKQRGRPAAKLIYGKITSTGSTSAVMRAIPRERVKRYLAASKYFETTYNSFLVAAHTEALARWKKQRNEPCKTIRAQIHQDIRKTKDEFREFGNKFSPFIVMVHAEDKKDIPSLIRYIHQQTVQAKKSHMAEKIMNFTWIYQYTFLKKFLPLGNRILNKPTNPMFGDSFTISNCGKVWAGLDGKTYLTRLGDSEATECFMPGYPAPSIGVFTSLFTFRDKLCLSFSHYKWALSEEDAEKYIDLLEQTLEEMADLAQV